jgi:hypothetical protein
MPRGSIDDLMFGNRKILDMRSDPSAMAAIGLWTLANSWCNNQLTDGFVPSTVLAYLGGTTELAELLAKHKLWHKVEGGYQFHDWEDCNQTRAEVLDKRSKDATRKGNTKTHHKISKAIKRMESNDSDDSFQDDSGWNPDGIRAESEAPHDGFRSESEAPSPSPSPKEREGANADAPNGAAPGLRKRPDGPVAKAKHELKAAIAGLAKAHGHAAPPTPSKAHLASGASKVVALVESGAEVVAAAERVARAAYEHLGNRKASSFGWALNDCVIPAEKPKPVPGVGMSQDERARLLP